MSAFSQSPQLESELNDIGEIEDDMRQSVTCISSSTKTDFDIKVVIVGDKGVGKTSFISQYYHNMAVPPHGMSTVNRKVVDVVNRKQRCTVAVTTYDDTHVEQTTSPSSSSSHSRAMNTEHCRALYADAHGVFIMFDVTDRQTFTNLQHHLFQMAEWGNDDAMVFFLANHSDIDTATDTGASVTASPGPAPKTRFGGEESTASAGSRMKRRVVTAGEAEAFAETYGGFMLDTSALSGDGVTTAYEAILYAVTTIISSPEPEVSESTPTVSQKKPSGAEVAKPKSLHAKLEKKSKYLQSWNERFFHLQDGILYFQRVDGAGNPRNTLFMNKNTKFTKIGDLQIEVVARTARKDMLLRFANTATRDEWSVELEKHGLYGTFIDQAEKYDNSGKE